MIYKLNPIQKNITKLKGITLSSIGWKEFDLQDLMFNNLESLLPEDELLLIMQSVKGQEEPDIMAIDKNGDLFIFELKAWESEENNILQVLRYGQIFGQKNYDDLNRIFLKNFPDNKKLLDTLNKKFTIDLKPEDINKNQQFVLITNGLDFKTRAAVQYWGNQGVKIKNWLYKLYKIGDDILLDFGAFRKHPNPFEDIDEGYYILNTNIKDGKEDDEYMLKNQKAAAFFTPWKHKIKQLTKGDKVFLYRSGTGIVAMGISTGKLEIQPYRNNKEHSDETYSVKLESFRILNTPISASKIKEEAKANYVFMQTMFSIDKETGEKLWKLGK